MNRYLLLAALVAVSACHGKSTETDTGTPVTAEGPVLAFTPPASATAGADLPIAIDATDDDDVDQVVMFYRTTGEAVYQAVYLDRPTDGSDTWTTTLPGDEVDPPTLELYFKATDATQLHTATYLPDDAPTTVFDVPIDVIGQPLPFEEDFEDAPSNGTIFDIGWSSISLGFEGSPWWLDSSQSHGGDVSAGHRRGAQGIDPLSDWLVSPALDLSAVSSAEITWWELGKYTDLANHSLWVSTTSSDPTDGSWVEVEALPAPAEGEWSRTPVIDLSAYAGQKHVWIGWWYQGQYADEWYIDDVRVKTLGADLQDAGVSWTPDPVDPGATATVTLDLANTTTIPSGDLTVDWAVDPSYGTFDTPTTASAIAANGSGSVSADLHVDASVPRNSYVPFTVTVSDGADSWTFDEKLVVGFPSSADITIRTDKDGLLQATLGVGDPSAPDYSVPVVAEVTTSGTHTYAVDITDAYAWLPPSPGPLRWWLAINSASDGQLLQFDITYDDATTPSDDLDWFTADIPETFYLPRPPDPEIVSSYTSPTTVSPGSTVDWTVTVQNQGAATVGETTVTLSSSDPDVTVLTPDPVELAASGWAEKDIETVPLRFSVSSAHTDSTPVTLTLTFQDAIESWTETASVDVPWPVMAVTAVKVDDWADGDDDGLPDPGETFYLDMDLTNVGDLDAFGAVSCTLAQTGGTGTATLLVSSTSFGLLPTGVTKNKDTLQVTVDGAVGDTIDFTLTCTDTKQTYTPTFQLEIGARPWVSLTALGDACGDAVGGYEFDFVGGRYRSDGTTLSIQFDSCTAYDPTTVFIESWMESNGADYSYYQLVIQSGVAKMRGYWLGSFTTLSVPTVTAVDADTLQVDIDLTTMGLPLGKLSGGFASGFCGGSGGSSYYCDELPDDWGDPYSTGFNTANWTDMSW